MTKRCNKDVSPECTSPIPVSTSDSNMSKLCASRNSQLGTRAWTNPESAGSNFTDVRQYHSDQEGSTASRRHAFSLSTKSSTPSTVIHQQQLQQPPQSQSQQHNSNASSSCGPPSVSVPPSATSSSGFNNESTDSSLNDNVLNWSILKRHNKNGGGGGANISRKESYNAEGAQAIGTGGVSLNGGGGGQLVTVTENNKNTNNTNSDSIDCNTRSPHSKSEPNNTALYLQQVLDDMPKTESWDQATTITGTSGGTSSLENDFNFNNDPSSLFPAGGSVPKGKLGKGKGYNASGAVPIYMEGNFEDDERAPLLDRCFPSFVSGLAITATLVTPVLFALLPSFVWSQRVTCNELCTSMYLTMCCKMVVLAVGCWALHLRRPRANLPSNSIARTFILILLGSILASFWGFYAFRLIAPDETVKYDTALNISNTVTDTLLFFHYLAFILLEVCHLRTNFIIKVVRNTDGESKFYSVGRLSIQNSAIWILQNYYRDFPIYNPYLLKIPSKKSENSQNNGVTKYQVYDIDGTGAGSVPSSLNLNGSIISNSRAIMAASARRRESSRNERFYEEQEYELKVAKRRARLIVAAEEAFYHIRRSDNNDGRSMFALSAQDAAVAIWPSMARALLKYLRVTRQTHIYRQSDLLEHLQTCITLNFTPRAFLEKFIKPEPVVTDPTTSNTWELVSNFGPNSPLQEGMVFQLKQEAFSLIVYVARVPIFNISERPYDRNDQFVLSLNQPASNTSAV